MKGTRKRSVASFLLAALATGTLQAAVIPGRWEKVEQLPLPSSVRVVLISGDKLQGRLSEITSEAIRLTDITGSARDLPKSSVSKIFLVGGPFADTLWDGALVGAGVGAGSYLIGHAALCCAPNEPHDAGAAAVFAGLGLAIGLLSDMAKKADEMLVYQAR